MTIPMSRQQDIRRLDARGLSRSEIARRLKVDRGTVAKYANMEDCSPRPPSRRRVKSVLDGHRPLVDSWLEAGRLMPRKQRHTARRVYDRLVAERGFKGSCSTVLRYVREWRRANREPGDGYVEPAWAPGCAQMDFGRAGEAWLASGSTTIAWWSRSRIRANAMWRAFPRRTPNASARVS